MKQPAQDAALAQNCISVVHRKECRARVSATKRREGDGRPAVCPTFLGWIRFGSLYRMRYYYCTFITWETVPDDLYPTIIFGFTRELPPKHIDNTAQAALHRLWLLNHLSGIEFQIACRLEVCQHGRLYGTRFAVKRWPHAPDQSLVGAG